MEEQSPRRRGGATTGSRRSFSREKVFAWNWAVGFEFANRWFFSLTAAIWSSVVPYSSWWRWATMAKNGGAVAPCGPSQGRSITQAMEVLASAMEGRFIFSTPTATAMSDNPAAMAAYAERMADCPEAQASSVRWRIRLGRSPICSAASGATWDWKANRSGSAAPTNNESTSSVRSSGTARKRAAPTSWANSGQVAARTPKGMVAPPTSATFRTFTSTSRIAAATRSPASEVVVVPPWS